ncbi:acireductone synthase [Streptomyces cinereospinus]|uniref:Enolase-phosphatase E1 n=1 Tax=Streptomyces cinereospinus TaxID=285561 RepID=A0ABV5N9Y9_9ACTN
MTVTCEADAVVLDIEGTTSATAFVTEVLYPYSRRRFGALLNERNQEADVRRAVDQVRRLLGDPQADMTRVETALHTWLAEDRKVTPLKTLQGIAWAEGFARGELASHFYDDVAPALRQWHSEGVRLHVYSSGSVAAQRAWFAHSTSGDLSPLIDGLFDTENIGPKQSSASYRAISEALTTPPGRTLFLSDRPAELDAARAAGWLTVGVRRPGEPYHRHGTGGHPLIESFADVRVRRTHGEDARNPR